MNWKPGTILMWYFFGEDSQPFFRMIKEHSDDDSGVPRWTYLEYNGYDEHSYFNESHKVVCTSFEKRPK